MLLQQTDALPEGPEWLYELKLDGYRAIALVRGGTVSLRSRNDKDFAGRYPAVVEALSAFQSIRSWMANSSRWTKMDARRSSTVASVIYYVST